MERKPALVLLARPAHDAEAQLVHAVSFGWGHPVLRPAAATPRVKGRLLRCQRTVSAGSPPGSASLRGQRGPSDTRCAYGVVVTGEAIWPAAEVIETERLLLEPLRADHAVEMAAVLDDQRLHDFIGGRPATLEQLRARYIQLVAGHSADGSQGWLNWVVRHRRSGVAVELGSGDAAKQRRRDG